MLRRISFLLGLVIICATNVYATATTDSNEASDSVYIAPVSGGISYAGQTGTLTVPALSAVALTQTPSSGGGGGATAW